MWRAVSNDDIPQVLESLDLPGITKYMENGSCKNVFVMAGAGISTSAGIPDFRSPDTGLYANLARLRLPYPEAVFDISFFKRNPRPFYVLAHELAPGKFRPTPTHSFIRLLAKKGFLHTCFTQNIDTLERAAGVPPDKIIEAHGSFADQHCIKCGAPYPHEKIKMKIEAQDIPVCGKRGCGGYVKPDIVFFGESLPDGFSAGVRHLRNADLLIVMGTSLTVHPFASLTELVPDECPRLLLNLDHVGGWGSRANDVACLMPCDSAVRELCGLLGWEKELEDLWAETDPSPKEVKEKADELKTGGETGEVSEREAKRDAVLDDIVDKLAETIGGVTLEDEAPSISDKSDTQEKNTASEDKDDSKLTEHGVDESQEESSNEEKNATKHPSPVGQPERTAPSSEQNLVTSSPLETANL